MGDIEGAQQDLQSSIDLVPSLTQSWVKIASVYMEQSNPAKTFECFEEAIKHNPDDPDIYYHRGQGTSLDPYPNSSCHWTLLILILVARDSIVHHEPIRGGSGELHEIHDPRRHLCLFTYPTRRCSVQIWKPREQYGYVQANTQSLPAEKRASELLVRGTSP